MKRKLFFSLIALVAIVITGFALSGNTTPAQPSTPPGMLFVVNISGNSLIQDCGETVRMSFGGKVMEKPYTGASTYYFYLNKPSFTGTACASVTTTGKCEEDVEILGPCITSSWTAGDISTFTVQVYKDEL